MSKEKVVAHLCNHFLFYFIDLIPNIRKKNLNQGKRSCDTDLTIYIITIFLWKFNVRTIDENRCLGLNQYLLRTQKREQILHKKKIII